MNRTIKRTDKQYVLAYSTEGAYHRTILNFVEHCLISAADYIRECQTIVTLCETTLTLLKYYLGASYRVMVCKFL